jgi:hypothetical protein
VGLHQAVRSGLSSANQDITRRRILRVVPAGVRVIAFPIDEPTGACQTPSLATGIGQFDPRAQGRVKNGLILGNINPLLTQRPDERHLVLPGHHGL